MNLLESLSELVAFAREQGGDERLRIRQACRAVEKKILRLRECRSTRATGRVCKRCGKGCHGVLCFRCWHEVPETFPALWKSARTLDAKREVIRALTDYLARNPKEAR